MPELVDMLGIKRWTLPMPKDRRCEWAFEMREYSTVSPAERRPSDWSDPSRRAVLTIMPTGEGTAYRFWLSQGEGTSSGVTRIDVCDNPDDVSSKCETGQMVTQWYQKPLPVSDGEAYVLCDVRETLEPGRHRVLVMYLTRYKLEDMNR